MFSIDFSVSTEDILNQIKNRDTPAWAIPVFDFIRDWSDPEITGFPVQTSGSTGTPKVIKHSRSAMIASAARTCDFFSLKQGDTALLSIPAAYIGGKMMIVRSAIRGMKLICIEPTSNPLAGSDLDFSGTERIHLAAFTPMQMSLMLDMEQSRAQLDKIKTILLGGGEVSYPLQQRLQSIPSSVYETYGMTETISHIALKKLNGSDRSEYFKVLEGVKISTDERGCLVIEAPHLSTETLITNDLVKIISEREFQWLGRYDNIINSGGIKIYAEEIERKLQPFISTNYFIAGTPDEVLGEKVTLILEASDPGTSIRPGYEEALSKYERPRQILSIEKFAHTENGKINKKETMKQLTQR